MMHLIHIARIAADSAAKVDLAYLTRLADQWERVSGKTLADDRRVMLVRMSALRDICYSDLRNRLRLSEAWNPHDVRFYLERFLMPFMGWVREERGPIVERTVL